MRRSANERETGAQSLNFRDHQVLQSMKQLNVWPMLLLLIAVIFIIIWLRPHG